MGEHEIRIAFRSAKDSDTRMFHEALRQFLAGCFVVWVDEVSPPVKVEEYPIWNEGKPRQRAA